MQKIAVFIFICLLLTQPIIQADNTPFSFIPATPINKPDFNSTERKPFIDGFRHCTILLEIDKKGKVKKINPEENSDSLIVRYVGEYLKSFDFTPAIRNDKNVKSVLPVQVNLSGRIAVPDLSFPLTKSYSVPSLLKKVQEVNQISFPSILKFPSYAADVKPNDTSSLYKYQIYRIDLDEEGRLLDYEKIRSTYPAYDDQIQSALLYAEFAPLIYEEKNRSTSAYLKISYFPIITYPTKLFDSSYAETLSQLKKRRIEMLPISSKILSEPLPRTIPDHLFSLSNIKYSLPGSLEAFVHVDTFGFVSLLQTDAKQKYAREAVRKICKKQKLYPAVDISGNKVDFYGYLRFERFKETNIRIRYLWLE